MTAREIGRETSRNLTEIRTVLSRAETALDDLQEERVEGHYRHGDRYADCPADCPARDVTRPDGWAHGWHETARYPDPDYPAAHAALTALVDALGKFRRTGRPRKAKSD